VGASVAGIGASVGGIEVGEAGIWVGFSMVGSTVFVGRGVGLTVGATVTARSQARVTTINRDRNKSVFFMVKFPFMLKSYASGSKNSPVAGGVLNWSSG
jgi:hypothetical protein